MLFGDLKDMMRMANVKSLGISTADSGYLNHHYQTWSHKETYLETALFLEPYTDDEAFKPTEQERESKHI